MQSETIQKLAEALIKAQAEFGHVVKDKTAQAGSFKYNYADLGSVIEATQGPLAKHGLVLIQAPQSLEGSHILESRLLHTSGEWVFASWPLPSDATPQQMGSALTYARRYSALALLGIAPDEDDDGKAAEKAKRPAQKPAQPKPAAAPPAAPKKQITLMRALDASETHFPASVNGAVAALQALDVMLEESMDNWEANREVAMRIMTTVPDAMIGPMSIKDHVTELVHRFEGPIP